MSGYCAFDIEIATEIPDGEQDWKALRPLGISCAATLTDRGELRLWHGAEGRDGRLAERMALPELEDLVRYLVASVTFKDSPVVTWNGLGFDFDILAEEVAEEPLLVSHCHLLARYDHIDIAFQMLCEKGFMCGLQAAALGMGLAGKTEGMHGDLAPKMWAQGRQEQDRVLEYVAQDVRTTAELYRAILERRQLVWQTRRGSRGNWWPTLKLEGQLTDRRMLAVQECLQLPEPDVSWLADPWPRAKFAGWLMEPLEIKDNPHPGEEMEGDHPALVDSCDSSPPDLYRGDVDGAGEAELERKAGDAEH